MEKDIHIIISRVLSGQYTLEDEADLKKWLSQSPLHQALYDEIKPLWQQTRITENLSNKDRVFDKILNDIQIDDPEEAQFDRKPKTRYRTIALIAASVILILSASFSYFLVRSNQKTAEEPQAKIEWVEKENPAGQKSKIYLPDGTIAYLNAESKLRYIADFTDTARDIYLTGEAYFEVKKDTTKPFTVHSEGISVTALGTIFNVSSFAHETSSIVALVEGEVGINAGEQYEILSSGESLILQKEKKEIKIMEINLQRLTGWKDGTLIFEGDTLYEVVKKLERWYGVEITISGKPDKDMKYSGEFSNEYLSNVLKSMSYGREFDFTIIGKQVTLKF